jgi:hypothetical protein
MSGVNPSDVLSVRGGVELVLAEDLNVLAAQRN